MLDLYIGNKNYSSWSLRAWLLMKHFGIPFREHLVSVAGRDYNPALKPLAGNARVPCLHDGGFQVWESIAIAEFLAERHPELWLAGARARARARCISAEMHAGFVALRTAMPMNLKLRLRLRGGPAGVGAYRVWVSVFVSVRSIMRTSGIDPQQPFGPCVLPAGNASI